MILAELKERTKRLHAQTESAIALMTRLASRESYMKLLARMLGFYLPIERLMTNAVNCSDLGIDLQERQKTHLLGADLAALGLSPKQIDAVPICSRLPTMETVSNVFGCLYVLEGSTLGGQFIRREVQQRLGLTPEHGCAFFAGYQDRTATAWREFGYAITQFMDKNPQEEERVVNTAAETFERFKEWVAC
jgi:heme oxygenase (biliverdin-IX-beta and delta-forming)